MERDSSVIVLSVAYVQPEPIEPALALVRL